MIYRVRVESAATEHKFRSARYDERISVDSDSDDGPEHAGGVSGYT